MRSFSVLASAALIGASLAVVAPVKSSEVSLENAIHWYRTKNLYQIHERCSAAREFNDVNLSYVDRVMIPGMKSVVFDKPHLKSQMQTMLNAQLIVMKEVCPSVY